MEETATGRAPVYARSAPPAHFAAASTGTELEIVRFVGQRKLSLTADTYTHVLVDDAELDYAGLLAS